MEDEISLDLAELRQLQTLANRPRVMSLISSEIRNLEKLLAASSLQNPMPTPSPTAAAKVPTSPALAYSPLASFSWDQDTDKVKVYISLSGIDEQKNETEFKSTSVDVKIHTVEGKNYRFSIPKLNKEIVPEKCKVLVKPTRMVIILFKASRGNWLDLHLREDKLKPSIDKDKDPMAGIMDLMKNMYADGDDEMKKTIAKAWSDARSGKAADTLKAYR